jgi:hypothetical protein
VPDSDLADLDLRAWCRNLIWVTLTWEPGPEPGLDNLARGPVPTLLWQPSPESPVPEPALATVAGTPGAGTLTPGALA